VRLQLLLAMYFQTLRSMENNDGTLV
jgi:hypothetical protein